MLDGLLAQLTKPQAMTAATVPPVPPLKNQREPLQAAPLLAVPQVPQQKTKVETKVKLADRSRNERRDPDDGRRFCHECQRLINGRCTASKTRYRPVDTHPKQVNRKWQRSAF